jgi:hypothetical protein
MNRLIMWIRVVAGLSACCAFAACSSSGGAPPSVGAQTQQLSARRNDSAAALYILNRELPKAAGFVSIYSGAGARFIRTFGVIKNETFRHEDYADMAADTSGHLYLYPAKTRGQLFVYENFGQHLLQTIQFHKFIFGALTLDGSGNLFTGDGGLYEFASAGSGTLSERMTRKIGALSYWVATDAMGDVGAAGGINGFNAFAAKKAKPFWTLHAPGVEYLNIAFDPSNNLYVVQAVNGIGVTLNVYAPGATTPSYTITNGAYAPGQLAFDGAGNLYVLNYCTYSCGTIKNSISIYAPGATTPTTVLQPPTGTTFNSIAVSAAGYLAVLENLTYDSGGPVVVYPPGATSPSITISTGLQRPSQMAFGG